MAEVLSPEQVREQCIRDMGPRLGPVYHALWNQVVWLHIKWDQYVLLYGHSPGRVALLNKVAPHLFWVIQETMHDEILLHMARLTDRRRDTLRFQRLPKLISDGALASELQVLVQAAVSACESAKASRDQRVAHLNYSCALELADFDPNPSRAEVKTALRAVRAVLNRLARHYWHSDAGCEYFSAPGDGDSLVHYTLKGVRAEERRMERLRQGKPLPEDLEPEDEL